MNSMHHDVERILFTEEEIVSKVKELGDVITKDYAGKNLLVVGILKGSAVFMSDLIRAINLDCSIDFMRVSSYGSGTRSTGNINIELDLRCPIDDYDVLIVEDILDSGNTLSCLKDILGMRNPKSLKICTLLDKPDRRLAPIYADYIGYTVPNYFVVGYGLDYDEKYRNLPYVGILKPEVYTE